MQKFGIGFTSFDLYMIKGLNASNWNLRMTKINITKTNNVLWKFCVRKCQKNLRFTETILLDENVI